MLFIEDGAPVIVQGMTGHQGMTHTARMLKAGTNIVGGVRKDLSREHQRWILDEMDTLEAEMRRLEKVTMEDYTVKKRTVGIGVMTAQEAIQLGAAGPTLRGRKGNTYEHSHRGMRPHRPPTGACPAGQRPSGRRAGPGQPGAGRTGAGGL